MKKLTLLLITLCMLITTTYAYNLTKIVNNNKLTTSVEEGKSVTIKYTDVAGYTFSSWSATGVTLANPTEKTITFIMPANDVTITPNAAESTKYTLTTTINNVKETMQKAQGSSVTLTAVADSGYEFTGWTATGITVENTATITFTMPANDVTIVANYEKLPWNAPVIASGLTPVNWNGSSWETTTEANWDYNYNSVAEATHSAVEGNGDGKWANAQTDDGSLYVWIPRYSYKITSGEHASGNSWNSLDAAGTNKIEVKFSNGTTDDTSDSYIAHPAFDFGGTQLKGIWVAKYEASRNDATSSSAGSGTTPSSKPGVISWRSISISDIFNYAYNLNRSLESHMMKNSEWGAVAYLTNAIGRIPYINNSSSYITGNAGGSQDASSASGVTNAWNTANGVKASTTHNVYGIYDMSGGAYEYVAAYVNNSYTSDYGANVVNGATKYKDVYPIGTSDTDAYNYAAWSSIKGDAVYETSSSVSGTTSWDGDFSYVPDSYFPFFVRGGGYSNGSGTGVFYFFFNDGNGSAVGYNGFRAVFSIQ